MGQAYTLLVRLEGPMQSWGFRSRFDIRDTSLEPTRSGVIGLLCAAMGIGREEDISRFDSLRMGVRVEKEGRPERDFHTALEVVKADAKSVGTVVSRRYYLADAVFLVGLESDNKALLEEIAGALTRPEWFLFLGRKAFPLSAPPLPPCDYIKSGKLEDTICYPDGESKRLVLEAEGGERVQEDWPVSFASRKFKPRKIRISYTREGEQDDIK